MKRFIYNRSSVNYKAAAVRIMDAVLSLIPSNKHVVVLVLQDLKVLENSRTGVYYVTDKLPVNANVIESDVKHYINKKNW